MTDKKHSPMTKVALESVASKIKAVSQRLDIKAKTLSNLDDVNVMILAYLGQTPEVPRTDLRAKHHS